mmetsp:Transcript_5129/g.7449  ORF Transcript_5129/g.7449 Transcript_5129/m.7449 type:complete len:95 (+) Transcript_5129:580-864(+)
MCPNKSIGCNFKFPVSISPLATTLRAAKIMHKTVRKNPKSVKLISPKVAIATPNTTGRIDNCLCFETVLPRQMEKAMVIAGTRLLITWLKLTDT